MSLALDSELIGFLKWPLLASLLLPWLLVYLGLQIVKRGIIFVDLALAQMAAFGTCLSLLAGYDAHDWQSYAFSLGFTLVGAVLLTFTRMRDQRVPQEALIGIIYVVGAAAAILVLSKSPGDAHELQRSLVGELLVVPPREVIQTTILFVVVGVVHLLFRRQFAALSDNPAAAEKAGMRVRWWDFVFYALFGLVVTSFVHIAGVLLVFSYLVAPAICAVCLCDSLPVQFLLGWLLATFAGIASLLLTAQADLPIGAATVCILGLIVGVVVALTPWWRGRRA